MSSEREETSGSPHNSNCSHENANNDSVDDVGKEIIEATSENKKDEDEINNRQVDEEVQKINEILIQEDRPEVVTPKPNKELKSILALSKEANLDTNITYKRKSVEPGGKQVEKSDAIIKRRGSTGSNSDIHRAEKKLIKSQIQELTGKHPKGVGINSSRSIESPGVTSDSEDSKETKEKDGSNSKMSKRKRESLSDCSTGGASEEHGKRSRKLSNNLITMNNKNKDIFCWRCHHENASVFCETCPRSFHQKCLRQNVTQPNHWLCPECVTILKAENLKQRSPAMRDMTLEHLCGLLKFALKRMMQVGGCEPFIHPVSENEFPEYKNYVVQPMDLTCLEKNIKDNLYGSTQAFEADAKWILHNSIIFNSYQSKLTTIAKGMIKICKQEMAEIENCANCYLNANTKKKTWFIEVCPKPHLLVWAKLKGFPYWPAKAMRSNTVGMVDVRFFGAHDRAWVPFKECFLFSLKDPNSNKQKRNDINESIKELKIHIENLKRVYGEFRYAPYRVLYEPDQEIKQIQLMVPAYDPDVRIKAKPFKRTPNKPNTNGTTSPDAETSREKLYSDTEASEPSGKETDVNESDKSGSDFGGEDEEMDSMQEQGNENDVHGEQSDKFSNVNTDSLDESIKSSDISGDLCSVIGETNVYMNNRTVRGGKVRMRGGYTNTSGKIKVIPKLIPFESEAKRRYSCDELELPSKLTRRNSDQSVKSDSSRLSNISDKISKVDISENVEITLGNDTSGSLSISENITPTSEILHANLPEITIENKRKPIVQVNFGANENTEFTISPQSKSRIADRLMKKLTEPIEEQILEVELLESQVPSNKEDVTESSFSNLNQTVTETDLLLEKFKHKGLTVLEEITELSPDTEIFETKSEADKKAKNVPKANTTSDTNDVGTEEDESIKSIDNAPLTRQEIKNIILSVPEDPVDKPSESNDQSLEINSNDKDIPEDTEVSSKTVTETSDKSLLLPTQSNDSMQDESEKTEAEKNPVTSTGEENNSSQNQKESNDALQETHTDVDAHSDSKEIIEINNTSSLNKVTKLPTNIEYSVTLEKNVQIKITDKIQQLNIKQTQPANIEERNKRKRSSGSDKNDEIEEISPLQKKLIKVVSIEDIKKKNLEDTNDKEHSPNSKSLLENRLNTEKSPSTTEKEQNKSSPLVENDLSLITIKSEPSSDDEVSDSEYMELKRKYLSALNISERMPEKPKQTEIRTRSKAEERRFKVVDNLSKVIDDVASRYSIDHANDEITLTRIAKKKEIFIKPLSKMQLPKQKARKSFPMPTIKNVYPAKKDTLKLAKSIITPIISATTIKSTTLGSKPSDTANIMFLAQPPSVSTNLTILPPNQPITYSANMGNPILTMVQHPVGSTLSNVFIQQTPIVSSSSIITRTETTTENESQNYIPQSGASLKTSTCNITNKSTLACSTETVAHTSVSVPALAPLSAQTTATNVSSNDPTLRPTDLMDELQTLNSFVPETLTRAISDIMCRAPPKLKPRPPGPLSMHFDEGFPSAAGNVTSRVNSISHRLSDYFRGMLVELLQEMGSSENPEAEIARVKLENEELKHKHAEEILEIKKNISSILKDIQKSLADERNRLVEETRSSCETECLKRVEEAKSKQWCANCSKEAQFYCCWNTSYCDYPCQQKHWPKHMSKCTQNIQNTQQLQSTTTTCNKQPTQPLVLRPTTAPKGFTTKTLIAKPTKVFVNRSSNNKNSFNFVRTTSGNHITLVESTPGNYELLGNGGPISVGGKVITNIGKIKCGNVISVTSPSNAGATAVTASGQKTVVIAQPKQSVNTTPKTTTVISDDECE